MKEKVVAVPVLPESYKPTSKRKKEALSPKPDQQTDDDATTVTAIKMITIAVQPPSHAQAGTILYPPLVVSSESEADYDFVQVALLDPYGRVIEDQLWGTLSSSKQSAGDGHSSRGAALEYAAFPDLALTYPGTYALRVTAIRMDYSSPDGAMAIVVTSQTTREIYSYEEPVASETPCKQANPSPIPSHPIPCHCAVL